MGAGDELTDEEVYNEHCQNCGRAYDYVWYAPNDLWNGLMGGEGGLRCIDCFDELCREKNIYLRWTCEDVTEIWIE